MAFPNGRASFGGTALCEWNNWRDVVDRRSDRGEPVVESGRDGKEIKQAKFWHCRVVVAALCQFGGACGWDSLGWTQEGPVSK